MQEENFKLDLGLNEESLAEDDSDKKLAEEMQAAAKAEDAKVTPEAEKVSPPIKMADLPELSAEELEKFLDTEDPEFTKALEAVAADKSLSLSGDELTGEEQALEEEIIIWQNKRGLARLLYAFFPFMPYVSLRWKKIKFRIFAIARSIWVRIKNFLYFLATEGRNQAVGKLKEFGAKIGEKMDAWKTTFKLWPAKTKVFFILFFFGSIGTFYFIYLVMTKGVLHPDDDIFLRTLEKVATVNYKYDPLIELEPFYENLRTTSNLFLIPKMVVNLKPSKGSGKNPMAAFEFFIEGMSPEVIVEVKDREVEVRDVMQRALEDFTYDKVESADGKSDVLDKLKSEVNRTLTTGKVKRVFFKTAIVKP